MSLSASVIVPVYNRADMTAQFVHSFTHHCDTGKYELIIVDDASSDDTPVMLSPHAAAGRVSYVRNETNQGFSKTCNRGANCARFDTLIFVNNDVLIHADFVDVLANRVRENPRKIYGPQVFSRNTGWNKFGEIVVSYVAGWCLALHRDLWTELGGFDERYSPYDVEDVDLSWAAQQKGYGIEQVWAPLDHISGASFPNHAARRAVTEANIEKLRQKWNLPPLSR